MLHSTTSLLLQHHNSQPVPISMPHCHCLRCFQLEHLSSLFLSSPSRPISTSLAGRRTIPCHSTTLRQLPAACAALHHVTITIVSPAASACTTRLPTALSL